MPSPFPGMDPYLESPDIWPDVHHELISGIRNALTPRLRPHYVARVELRVYVTDQDDPGIEVIIPDIRIETSPETGTKKVKPSNGMAIAIAEPEIIPFLVDDEIEIKEARLEIRHRESDSLVGIIEVMSPTNKVRGSYGRSGFLKKKHEAIESEVHWIEIDLLRAGVPSVTRPPLKPSDYRVLMYRAPEQRGRYWRFGVRQPLPTIGIPLRGDDPDVPLDLSKVFSEAYDHGAYDLSVDYRKEPTPDLNEDDVAWADQLLRMSGSR
jgi:hypothetical protein